MLAVIIVSEVAMLHGEIILKGHANLKKLDT